MCIAHDNTKIVFEALRTFRAIATAARSSAPVVVESEIIEQTIAQVRQVIRESDQIDEVEAVGLPKDASEFYSCESERRSLLGEEVALVKREVRPLYFGLKNIILQEIDNLDKEIDVHEFFIEEETAGFPASNHDLQSYVAGRSRSLYSAGPAAQYSNSKANQGGMPAPTSAVQSEGLSDAASDIASTSHQPSAAGYPTQGVGRMTKKPQQRRQEMISKYQNSQNAQP